jgi:hypothetical protein
MEQAALIIVRQVYGKEERIRHLRLARLDDSHERAYRKKRRQYKHAFVLHSHKTA